MDRIDLNLDISADVLHQMLKAGMRKSTKYYKERYTKGIAKEQEGLFTVVERQVDNPLPDISVQEYDKEKIVSIRRFLCNKGDNIMLENKGFTETSYELTEEDKTEYEKDVKSEIKQSDTEYYGDEIVIEEDYEDVDESLDLSGVMEVKKEEIESENEENSESRDFNTDDEEFLDNNIEELEMSSEEENVEVLNDENQLLSDEEDTINEDTNTEDNSELEAFFNVTDAEEVTVEGTDITSNVEEPNVVDLSDMIKDKVKEEVIPKIKKKKKKKKVDKVGDVNRKDVKYSKGMSLATFLRNNPEIRSIEEVKQWFTKAEIDEAVGNDEVLVKKGKFIL